MTKRKLRSKLLVHGHAGANRSSTYNSWAKMIGRCTNPNDDAWMYYGGRGITVCDSWIKDFRNFLSDMGERPTGLTLDRINTNEGYSRENCRWATKSTQQLNRRTTNKFGLAGISQDSKTGAYIAKVHVNKKPLILLYTYNLTDAINARLKWNEENDNRLKDSTT